jgi:hypothetical protein
MQRGRAMEAVYESYMMVQDVTPLKLTWGGSY